MVKCRPPLHHVTVAPRVKFGCNLEGRMSTRTQTPEAYDTPLALLCYVRLEPHTVMHVTNTVGGENLSTRIIETCCVVIFPGN